MKLTRKVRLTQTLPSDRELVAGLTTALKSAVAQNGDVTVLQRQLNTYSSSHPSEVVLCRLNGKERTVLIKYGTGHRNAPEASRGGVEYEAKVYQHILQPHGISSPSLLGVHEVTETGATWLIVEYLSGCKRLNHVETAIVMASAWLGEFHAYAESTWSTDSLPFLKVYDAEYYQGWVAGTERRLALLKPHYSWICELTDSFGEFSAHLSREPQVVIHGEFYPHNVLVQNGEIYPIDWESAAFGCPEIDFASLTDGWDAGTVDQCKKAYKFARWGTTTAESFERSVLLADMYWNLRWLSREDRKHPQLDPSPMSSLPWRLQKLKTTWEGLDSLLNNG